MSLRSHKIALRTNGVHDKWFRSQCGYARFTHNNALHDFKSGLSDGIFRSKIELNNRWNKHKKEYNWTKEQDQRAALYAIDNLGKAINNWRNKISKFPKFKKRGKKLSYTTDEQNVRVEGKRIKLPKIGWIGMFQGLRFEGDIKRVTISR